MLVVCCLELRYEYMYYLFQFCNFIAKAPLPSQGLRAFLPKPEMMTRPRNFTDLKNKVSYASYVFFKVKLVWLYAVPYLVYQD
jgi:hypothetical protein